MTKRESASSESQLNKFKAAAREFECDDNEQRFKERLGRLVKRPAVDNPQVGTEKDSPTVE